MKTEEEKKKYYKEYYQNNKEKESLRKKEYNSRPEIKKRRQENYQKNKKHILEQNKQYQIEWIKKPENKERLKETQRKWMEKPEIRKKYNLNKRQSHKKRYDYNKQYRLKRLIRYRIWVALKNYSEKSKMASSKKYGINFTKIIEHLKPFPKNMENYHIDHIIPLSIWNLNDPEHIRKAFLPENHQWLTTNQNLYKSNRLVAPCFKNTIK